MKRFNLVLVLLIAISFLYGCETQPSSDVVMNVQQEKLSKEAAREVGAPSITNFYEKRMMKMILELRDNPDLVNYVYLFAENTGQLKYVGKCIGFPIPYSTQYTNPMKIGGGVNAPSTGNVVLPQADPNGLFSPASAEGSWIMMIDPKTSKPKVCYFEPRVIVLPYQL